MEISARERQLYNSIATGWNTWDVMSVTSYVLLPQRLRLNIPRMLFRTKCLQPNLYLGYGSSFWRTQSGWFLYRHYRSIHGKDIFIFDHRSFCLLCIFAMLCHIRGKVIRHCRFYYCYSQYKYFSGQTVISFSFAQKYWSSVSYCL